MSTLLPAHYDSHGHGIYVGQTTEVEPSLLFLSTESNAFSFSEYEKRGTSSFLIDHGAVERSIALQPAVVQNLENEIGPYGLKLVDIYSENIHPTFPVLAQSFLVNYYSGHLEALDASVLAAVYAISSQWLTPEDLTLQALPNVTKLDDLAFALFSKSLQVPSIGTIQAGLLLMQRPAVDLRSLNSQIVNAAYELGLHLDCSSWEISPEEKGLRKRLAWALYMQDKWCSLIFGRPSLISDDNWIVKDLDTNDFEQTMVASKDEDEPRHSLFQQLIVLTKILSSILDIFYTVKAMKQVEDSGNNGTSLILERAKPVQIKLREWFGKLPPELKLDTVVDGKPSAIGLLNDLDLNNHLMN